MRIPSAAEYREIALHIYLYAWPYLYAERFGAEPAPVEVAIETDFHETTVYLYGRAGALVARICFRLWELESVDVYGDHLDAGFYQFDHLDEADAISGAAFARIGEAERERLAPYAHLIELDPPTDAIH